MMRRITDWILGREPIVVAEIGDRVSDVLQRTMAELSNLSDSDPDISQAYEIMRRAAEELAEPPCHDADPIIEAYVRGLPDSDYLILRYFKHGIAHSAIAEAMGTDVATVRRSLIKTYYGLSEALSGNSVAA